MKTLNAPGLVEWQTPKSLYQHITTKYMFAKHDINTEKLKNLQNREELC